MGSNPSIKIRETKTFGTFGGEGKGNVSRVISFAGSFEEYQQNHQHFSIHKAEVVDDKTPISNWEEVKE